MILLISFILSLLCLIYSIILNLFRYTTLEYNSFYNTLLLLLFDILPFIIQLITIYIKINNEGLYFFISSFSIYLMIRNYSYCVSGKIYENVKLDGKVYIITGSSAGIGLETARELARMGGTVILACRSKDKALQAAKEIITSTKCSQSKVIFLLLDLSDLNSVRKFVEEFHKLGFPLHGLINNAGVMLPERTVTKDGYEMMFTSNHLGHFLLTNLLLDDLEKTSGRVVNLSSSLHRSVPFESGFNFKDVMYTENYSLFGTYAHTKLANVIFTIELNRRLRQKKSSITTYSVHPGAVLTEVTRSLPAIIRIAYTIFTPFMLLIQKLPSQGAYCSIYAACSPSLTVEESGEYLFHCEPAIHNKIADDPNTGLKLWEISEKYCGMK